MQGDLQRGVTLSKCLCVLSGLASPTITLSAAIQVPTTLPGLAQILVSFRMSEASLREFREYYLTTVLKWVTNLSIFCALVFRDQRRNRVPCSAEVLFIRSATLIATSCTMDRLTEPWKQS